MSLQATPTVEASVDISLRVPRGESEDLQSGVAGVLAAVEAVSEVTVDRVTSVRPAYTDIRVDADATLLLTLSIDGDLDGVVEARLADGFGVTAVHDVVSIDRVEE